MSRRVPSFTILELAITMLIVSILTVIIYHTYFLFQKQFESFIQRKTLVVEFTLLQTSLASDFERSSAIFYVNGELVIVANAEERVKYSRTEENVIRIKDELVDTFKLKTSEWNVISPQAVKKGLVRHLTFTGHLGNENCIATISKHYSSSQLMDIENAYIYE